MTRCAVVAQVAFWIALVAAISHFALVYDSAPYGAARPDLWPIALGWLVALWALALLYLVARLSPGSAPRQTRR